MNATAAPWPADAVERRPIDSLVPYAKNARTHSEAQIEQICALMREFGFTIPVLVDEKGEIIAGHGRILAAKRIGYESVPVMVARGWTQRQIKAYRLADNQVALNAAWDVKLLAAELEDLVGLESLIGFGEGELEAIMRGDETRPLPTQEEARATLAERFGLPPFSVLNAREGRWQDRKRAWLALGIESELGRGDPDDKRTGTVTGSPLPAADYGESHAKGDGRGRAMKNGKTAARTFGQDLMRGEHKVGEGKKKRQGETASLKGGLTFSTTMRPYQKPKATAKKAAKAKAKGKAG